MKTPAALLGLGIGDALGMPFETLGDTVHPGLANWDGKYAAGSWSNRKTSTLDGRIPLTHLPAGTTTDDTDFAVALADSMLMHDGFTQKRAAEAYLHLARLRSANGMGESLQKAVQALDAGASCTESGVKFDDPAAVGNGTAMRVAPIGIAYRHSIGHILHAARKDAVITHDHPEAVAGSCMVALMVAFGSLDAICGELQQKAKTKNDSEFLLLISMGLSDTLVHRAVFESTHFCKTPEELFAKIGRRGNAAQTVATAIWCADHCDDDFEKGVQMAVRGGGDTDTRAAITGAILGARVGIEGIPQWMRDGIGIFGSKILTRLDEKLMVGPERFMIGSKL